MWLIIFLPHHHHCGKHCCHHPQHQYKSSSTSPPSALLFCFVNNVVIIIVVNNVVIINITIIITNTVMIISLILACEMVRWSPNSTGLFVCFLLHEDHANVCNSANKTNLSHKTFWTWKQMQQQNNAIFLCVQMLLSKYLLSVPTHLHTQTNTFTCPSLQFHFKIHFSNYKMKVKTPLDEEKKLSTRLHSSFNNLHIIPLSFFVLDFVVKKYT